jgi:hypothetical protein
VTPNVMTTQMKAQRPFRTIFCAKPWSGSLDSWNLVCECRCEQSAARVFPTRNETTTTMLSTLKRNLSVHPRAYINHNTRDRRGALSRTRNTRPEPRHETHTPPALSSQASFPISALPRGSGCQSPEASCHDCPLASSALPIRQAGLQEARLSAWTRIPRSLPTTKAASSSSALVLRYHALTSSTADAPS